ncbi:MAG TPA: DUF86 domain-containing protein [Ignavibacteria bacterium]|nr:DUF86 domain-containing protein [Ignavibacteria bacterium]HMQ99783.1 DUF86 domain-containing protein [Ignavibacteria bacterium]
MSKEKFFLSHIIESTDLVKEYLENVSMNDFYNSIPTQDMVYRRLEIIGEAVKNLSTDFKILHPEINWKKIAGMRDVLIHNYFGIDAELAWKAAVEELPKLELQIRSILDNM